MNPIAYCPPRQLPISTTILGRGTNLRHRHVKCIHRRKTRLLIKVRRVPHERASTKILNRPCDADYFRSSQIDAFEAVPVPGTRFKGFLELVGCHHHGDCLVDVEGLVGVLGRGEGEEGFFGVFGAAFADEPPAGMVRDAGGNGRGMYQGDSGAKRTPMMIGTGQIH